MAIFLPIILSIMAQADPGIQEFKIYSKDKRKYESFRFVERDGLIISESCKKKDCDALKAKPTQTIKSNGVPLLGNPASTTCRKLNGKNRIAFDSKNNQYDFCLFQDGSMADSWTLHKKLGTNK